ncbi:hypothetical protein C7N43_11835 [Sphingobacteriales bacterium UPWRP_1]|nr:hypothetical protein B6N25_13595 [Sphingobacteriales bacterium TSM_CSS]PSJ76818.1 hypothetical protein C7N43_11835 [Sphingobacteriales bacterium UPWRP_1]
MAFSQCLCLFVVQVFMCRACNGAMCCAIECKLSLFYGSVVKQAADIIGCFTKSCLFACTTGYLTTYNRFFAV